MESTYLVQPIVNGKKSCSCTSQTLHKPQVFTEKTTTVSHQIFICSVISFFLCFSEITFTFMWWEKQGKVYVGTLKAAATSKSGSALPK